MTLLVDAPLGSASERSTTSPLSGTPSAGLLGNRSLRDILYIQPIASDGTPLSAPAWLNGVRRKLQELYDLPVGWDGRRAPPSTKRAVEGTLRVLFAVMRPDSVTPHLVPLPDGGIQIEWHANGHDIEVEVEGDGDTGAWAQEPHGEVLDEQWGQRPSAADLHVVRSSLDRLTAQVWRALRARPVG